MLSWNVWNRLSATRRHIPEELKPHLHRRKKEKIKSQGFRSSGMFRGAGRQLVIEAAAQTNGHIFKRRQPTSNIWHVKSNKSERLNYTTVEAWNLT